MMNISPHFTLDELTISQAAARKGLDNTPTPQALGNLKLLASTLEEVRALVGKPIVVSSGYRSKEVNRAVGGSKTSAHMSGLAADINCPGLSPVALAHVIKSSGIKFDQLILEFDSWVHIAIAEGEPRRQLLTIRTGTGYMKGIV